MTPESAYAYLKSIRPRVLLASAQWQVTCTTYMLLALALLVDFSSCCLMLFSFGWSCLEVGTVRKLYLLFCLPVSVYEQFAYNTII